jgi:pimeloyl-ACP methyl ester carboxylesterase
MSKRKWPVRSQVPWVALCVTQQLGRQALPPPRTGRTNRQFERACPDSPHGRSSMKLEPKLASQHEQILNKGSDIRLPERDSAPEQTRVNAMLDHILPVSARAEGLKIDSAVGKRLGLSPLAAVRAPTLVVSARDDRYGTYASAQYTAGQIAGAQFIGFDQGGHTWVGHNDEVMAAITALLLPFGALTHAMCAVEQTRSAQAPTTSR